MFTPIGIALVATDLVVVNDFLAATSGVLVEVTRFLRREMYSHMVAQSSLSWKVVKELFKK